MRSNDDIEWPVHYFILSVHDLCGLPPRRLSSTVPTVPCSMIADSVSWRQTWPNHDNLLHCWCDSKIKVILLLNSRMNGHMKRTAFVSSLMWSSERWSACSTSHHTVHYPWSPGSLGGQSFDILLMVAFDSQHSVYTFRPSPTIWKSVICKGDFSISINGKRWWDADGSIRQHEPIIRTPMPWH